MKAEVKRSGNQVAVRVIGEYRKLYRRAFQRMRTLRALRLYFGRN